MKLEYELIKPDDGSCFRLIHTKTMAESFPWSYHYHPEFEIVCVMNGSGTRHVGHHMSTYSDGDLVLIGSNLPHAGFGLHTQGYHEEIVIQAKESVVTESMKLMPELKEIQQLLKKAEHGICFTGTTKEVLRKEVKKLPRLQPFERMILFWQLLKKMSVSSEFILLNPRQTIETGLHKHQKRLQEIFAYVEHHYHEDVDMKKVAGIAHLSIPSFCNYFKKIMHCTFTDFLNKYRIQKASMLLQQDKTVTEVCYECGFNNVSYFNKVFKDITHQTPSAFRHNFLQTERMAS